MPNRKVSTFSKQMTEKEAEEEKNKGTAIGKALSKADKQYEKRRRT